MQSGECTADVAKRVKSAREMQHNRLGAGHVNAHMDPTATERYAKPDEKGSKLIERAMNHFSLSARSYHRILKIGRTIADLSGSEMVKSDHIAEALQYRGEDILNTP